MNILQVIHGYPPFYMAGSEVYTWSLSRELARQHQVSVFTRIENPYAPPYHVTRGVEDGVTVRRINKPMRDYTFRDKYMDPRMDAAFRHMMRETQPDVVHFGHLSHLSSHLPAIAREEFGLPTVFTIHDFWMFCFRGQLVRPDLGLCDGPSVDGCLACARESFKEWMDRPQVEERLHHIRDVAASIDVFLAPSRTVDRFFRDQGVPASKIRFSPYGFDVGRLLPRPTPRTAGPLRVGFMGRIIPVKGIQVLLQAFRGIDGDASLDVWGSVNGHLPWLKELCENDPRVCFQGGYHNGQVQEVLEGMDVLVVPSVWLENSPLVIQEALLVGVPIITSDAGGMAELVESGSDGFLVPLGDAEALRDLLQRLVDQPRLLEDLRPDRSRVRTIQDDAAGCLDVYRELVPTRRTPSLPRLPAPRRVTFVTNPGLCNLHCPMCDTHSPHASKDPRDRPLLDFEVVERVVAELAPRGLEEIIPSTMGEPLLYPQFRDFLDLAARTGVRVNLTSNGTFPHGGVDAWAAALLPVVSDVKFSVNGIDPVVAEAVMPGLDPQRQLRDIQRYLEHKRAFEARGGRASTTTLQVTFLERNSEELPRLLCWAMDNGMDRFKGHHLWVTWPQLADQSLRRSGESIARWNHMVMVLRALAASTTRPDGSTIRLENIDPLPTASSPGTSGPTRCPFAGREAWVEADGSFQVCCCPSPLRRAFGDFGSLHETPFMEIWRSHRYRDFVASWGDHPNCRDCALRRPVQETDHA